MNILPELHVDQKCGEFQGFAELVEQGHRAEAVAETVERKHRLANERIRFGAHEVPVLDTEAQQSHLGTPQEEEEALFPNRVEPIGG